MYRDEAAGELFLSIAGGGREDGEHRNTMVTWMHTVSKEAN